MRDLSNKNSKDEKGDSSGTDEFPKPQDAQLQEGTLLLMEDALEERNGKNRRVKHTDVPASEERRKSSRRQADQEDVG